MIWLSLNCTHLPLSAYITVLIDILYYDCFLAFSAMHRFQVFYPFLSATILMHKQIFMKNIIRSSDFKKNRCRFRIEHKIWIGYNLAGPLLLRIPFYFPTKNIQISYTTCSSKLECTLFTINRIHGCGYWLTNEGSWGCVHLGLRKQKGQVQKYMCYTILSPN